MKQKFGSFIREKRLYKMMKLNQFAKQIGISNVYLSYIESGKRPAPSTPILINMVKALNLNDDEASQFYSLAVLSRSHGDFPDDLIEYISARPYIIEALRTSMENNATEQDWAIIKDLLNLNATTRTN